MRKFLFIDSDWDRIKLIGSYKMFHLAEPSFIYIGGTSSMSGRPTGFHKRFSVHKQFLEAGKHQSALLQGIVIKHGIAGLRFQILKVCNNREEVRESEQFYMDLLKPKLNSTISATSSLGYKHTQDTRKKMSQQRLGKKRKPMSIESRKKISDFAKTRDLSYLRSDSVRKKMSQIRKGKKLSEKLYEAVRRAVSQFTTDNVFIATYSSISEASIATKIDPTSISRVVNGKRYLAGGFVWKSQDIILSVSSLAST